MFAFLVCVRCKEDFVKLSWFIILRFCSKHFVILAGLKKIICYYDDFVIIEVH